MLPGIVRSLVEFLKRASAVLSRRDSRTARWAAGAFPKERIRWHAAQLSACAGKIDKCFLRTAAALEGLAGRTSKLVNASRRLLQCAEGREGDRFVFQEALDVIERPLDFNDECLRITAGVDESLASVATRIGTLGRFQARLEDSLKPLRILQIMFRIESASAPREILTLFVSLSEEIAHLMEQMATLIGSEFDAIESTAATVGELRARIGTLCARQRAVQTRRAGIRSSMEALTLQIEEDKVRDLQLIGAGEAIAAKTAEMVGALQYQDILNQRLQHVIEGLGDLAQRSHASGDALCFMRDALRVESAQIGGAAEALDGAMERLKSSLDGLAQEAGGLGHAGAGSGAAERMIQVLLATIRENTALAESTALQTAEIRAALEPVCSLLGNLTGTILGLSARIRLISLNAQIQAAQAGDGTGLEVLAGRARNIADQIVMEVARLAGELQDLKQTLNAGLGEIAATQAQSAGFLRLLREDGAHQESILGRFREAMEAECRTVRELIGEIQSESETLSASLNVRTVILESLGASRDELHIFAEALAGRLSHRTRSSRVEELALAYTAAAERSAHDRALTRDPAPILATPPVALAEGSIELF